MTFLRHVALISMFSFTSINGIAAAHEYMRPGQSFHEAVCTQFLMLGGVAILTLGEKFIASYCAEGACHHVSSCIDGDTELDIFDDLSASFVKIKLRDLKAGMRVPTRHQRGGLEYVEVTSTPHWIDDDQPWMYFEIKTNEGSITVSQEHFVIVRRDGIEKMVKPSSVEFRDELLRFENTDFHPVTITEISKKEVKGTFTLHTRSGEFIDAQGFLHSCYSGPAPVFLPVVKALHWARQKAGLTKKPFENQEPSALEEMALFCALEFLPMD